VNELKQKHLQEIRELKKEFNDDIDDIEDQNEKEVN
jgi:hypothetical protein